MSTALESVSPDETVGGRGGQHVVFPGFYNREKNAVAFDQRRRIYMYCNLHKVVHHVQLEKYKNDIRSRSVRMSMTRIEPYSV